MSLNGFGQTNRTIILTGNVTSCHTKKPVYKGVVASLIINDSIKVSVTIDTNGKYTIVSDARTLANNKCKLYAYQAFPQYRKVHQDCPAFEYQPYFGDDKVKIELPLSDTIKNDFCLGKVYVCSFGGYDIFFKKNSVEFINDSILINLKGLRCQIIDRHWKVELSSHVSKDEKDAMGLSLRRGECVKLELIKLGVPDSMLVVKGYGNEYPLEILDNRGNVREMKTEAEKEYVVTHSRRVVWSVLINNESDW